MGAGGTLASPAAAPWHTVEVDAAVRHLGSHAESGLSSDEAAQRLRLYGANELRSGPRWPWLKVLLAQLVDPMNWIFLALGTVCILLADYFTGAVLVVLSLVNIGLSFSQEYAAARTLAALQQLAVPRTTVIRDGAEAIVPSSSVVVGDIVVLKDGDAVTADARVIMSIGLDTNEAILTGESMPVAKHVSAIPRADEPLGDRKNMVYSSTTVVRGRGRALVVATGMQSEIGRLAGTLEESKGRQITKIQRSLYKMYGLLICVAAAGALIILGVNRFVITYPVAMHAVTAVLSVLPAGLTTVLTVTLVMGGKEMARQNAIVRKLKCLETLGSVTHIFSDKTGTLTWARMVVVGGWTAASDRFDVHDEAVAALAGKRDVARLAKCAALCNVAETSARQSDDSDGLPPPQTGGSPTEAALRVFAERLGVSRGTLPWQPLQEFPFSSALKRMTIVYERGGELCAFVKGAPEVLLPLCAPDSARDERIHVAVEQFSSRALRVLLLARRRRLPARADGGAPLERADVERDLEVLGLLALHDPPRPESLPSVRRAHAAGISVHVLTGDHLATAVSVAHQVGILARPASELSADELAALVTTGPAFDALTDAQIDALPRLPLVVARCSPDTKVKMVEAAHRRRYITAMTGDGVNDSPSLKIAHVGIAMGMNGSDIARSVSDIILADDNFATIIEAIAQGRRIYQNVQRFLLYYWVPLFGVAVMVAAMLWMREPSGAMVAPFTPIMLLFLYVALTPPAGTLSTQPASPTIMRVPPRPTSEGLFNREITADVTFYSAWLAGLVIAVFCAVLYGAGGGIAVDDCDVAYDARGCEALFRARATTLAAMLNLCFILSVHCRSYRTREWTTRAGLAQTARDRSFTAPLALLWALLLVFMYVPSIAVGGFHMTGITWEWGIVAAVTVAWPLIGDAWKALKNVASPQHSSEAGDVSMEEMAAAEKSLV